MRLPAIDDGVFTLIAATICMVINTVGALQQYQANIPNGNRIPHPCDRTTTWPGVGHQNVAGAGDRNQFGLDFAAAGRTWTQALCRLDSDFDGNTNGVELGDPNCLWTIGAIPSVTANTSLSHPGICEPITSASCIARNTFLVNVTICTNQYPSTSTSTSTTTTRTTVSTASTTKRSAAAISIETINPSSIILASLLSILAAKS